MTFAERLADQAKARERIAERAKLFLAESAGGRPTSTPKKPAAILPPSTPKEETKLSRPWASVRAGAARLKLYSRSENGEEVFVQPWAHEMVSNILQAADEGDMHLCLAWPIQFDSLVVLPALASIERNFARDLRGMRTLLYPGTYSSRAALQGTLIDRIQFSDLYRSLWTRDESPKIEVNTRSLSFEAILETLNDIRMHNPDLENPSLGEIVPAFMYEKSQRAWISVANSQVECSLKKVNRLARRRDIRDKVNSEWSNPKKAPGSLMVLHNSARKGTWKDALSSKALSEEGKPEVLLIDATSAADQRNYSAVRNIPDFLRYAKDNGYQDVGSVVITDDPKTFFVLRARLNELKLKPKTHIWTAEGGDSILSSNAVPAGRKPRQRSNANFDVGIVDTHASQVALKFQKLAQNTGNKDGLSHKALMAACFYILRLSNLPAGYKDLTAHAAEAGANDFGSQRNAWTPLRLDLQTALQSGVLNNNRTEVDKAIAKAEMLIDDWTDATPMALRILAEVQKHAVNERKVLSFVLPNQKYILLAHRFLQRKFGEQWATTVTGLDWHTLSSAGEALTDKRCDRHFVFIGINRNVLRLLLTHPDVPNGTTILTAFKQADVIHITLTNMIEIEAFKPFRGRMEHLIQQLERRLKEVPNTQTIGKLGEMTMTFQFEENTHPDAVGEYSYYKFELEGGGRAYSSGWLYLYDSDEHPFFRRATAKSIKEGDFIFEMSDELQNKLESALHLKNNGLDSVVYPERVLLKLYHDDVTSRCELFFKATKRSVLAREIHTKMVELDPKTVECRPSRIYYWLALQDDGDTRPHAPKDANFFKLFCKVLEINDEQAAQHWNFVRNARRLNQNLGRVLSARYAEILFQPESAVAYRKVSETAIKQLQQDALHCVYRVERVVPPQNKPKA